MMREYHVLNLGAGVQSTTLYLMRLFDVAIFADTGEEPEAVYAHLNWLRTLGRTPILVRSKGRRLGDDLMRGDNTSGGRFASIPAFVDVGEKEAAILKRQCSKEYKLEVIWKAIREDVLGLAARKRVPKNVRIHQYFGISLDEAGRAQRIRENNKHKYVQLHFPLVESLWTRSDCLNWAQPQVPHAIPRSACVFCPYRDDASWLELKKNPADWARALEVDEALRIPGRILQRGLRGKLYLHRAMQPLVQIQLNPEPTPRQRQLSLRLAQECLGVCGV